MKHFYLFIFALLMANIAFSQNEIKGTVVDHDGIPLPGANIMVQGTNNGAASDFNGNFSFVTDQDSGTLVISFVGYTTQQIPFDFQGETSLDVGKISLSEDANSLGEIVIVGRGVVDLEEDRKTPIAVSTITRDQIQLRASGNVEFPEVIKNTPNVYVSNQSGGFGDSEIFVRGFDQRNTAFLLNGQPINDMTNGKIFWSNWSGLSDIANAVQMQRGLGSSKLAISSVGGTMNMVTKATERNQGGFARFLVGNDSYIKGTISYDTGIGDNGWGFSFLLDYWQSHAKYADGTWGRGQTYFFSVGKKIGKHNFNLLITGAPQEHDQNFSKDMAFYDAYGRKYNDNYGFDQGKELNVRRNYYHKPVINLNWDWDIDDNQSLSTVLYASMGSGGGTGDYGNGISFIDNGETSDPSLGMVHTNGAYTLVNGKELIDWDYIRNVSNLEATNGFSEGHVGTVIASSFNNHVWYGGVMNYEYNKIKNLSLNVGTDIRFYTGDHYRALTNKLGLQGRIEEMYGHQQVVTKSYSTDPWTNFFHHVPRSQRLNYDYTEHINYQGVFGQAEWSNDEFSAFVQGSFSNQYYRRIDRGNFATTKKSKRLDKQGYNIKGGGSWNFAEGHSVYVNVGKYSRQPFNNSVFTNYADETEISNDLANETIEGYEAGYRFKQNNLTINVNAYYTKWKNRFLSASGSYDPNGDKINPEFPSVGYLFTNIAELHQGIEIDARWRVIPDLTLTGYGTYGKWEYDGETPVKVRNNEDETNITTLHTNLKNTKVGQAPQSTVGLGFIYDVLPGKMKIYGNWNYYTDFYGFVDVEDAALATLDGVTYQPEKLNTYSLIDLGAAYTYHFNGSKIRLSGNVYNLLDHYYISQKDNYGYYLGNGTTYNVSLRYTF